MLVFSSLLVPYSALQLLSIRVISASVSPVTAPRPYFDTAVGAVCRRQLTAVQLTAAGDSCAMTAAALRTIQYQVQGQCGLEKVKLKCKWLKINIQG